MLFAWCLTDELSDEQCINTGAPVWQGEPGYVLGGVEVIPGQNGQPGHPVSKSLFLLGF